MSEERYESDAERIAAAKQSFTGRALTESQFDQSWALADVLKRNIESTGSFREQLTDHAHAFARTERFDSMKAETILRDQFKEKFGQTMNQMREDLLEREDHVRDIAKDQALERARAIGPAIREGETKPFWQAHDQEATRLAKDLNITESGAKTMMRETFQEAEGKELYSYGKELEERHHVPAREARREEAKPVPEQRLERRQNYRR